MEQKHSKVICVSSFKGGVGKTIITLNLAGIYYTLNKKVLIIDLDLYGGAIALSLHARNRNDITHLIDDLANNRYQSFDHYIEPYNDNIDILACPTDINNINKINYQYLNNIIKVAVAQYDVILIDTTHGIIPFNLMVYQMSDLNLFIVTNDPYDLKNTKNVIHILKEKHLNNYKILLNEARDTGKDYFTTYDIKKFINTHIDYTIPKSFYIKNIDKYLLDNEILVLNNYLKKHYKDGYNKLLLIAKSLIK